ncbi:class A beta-lactamase [Chryseobacterium oryzae]|uniref:Beta-lactamase n=1 Tax=Chryseobacterium oryzae TaxID=2929799 RepID=A0ABY4BH14_9FLAO|nr:class A beta-lactamase [Chryseobacterium oryzae]UOE37033.1 class A beta-lactamase [Chryseobacterium oryzae]
MNPKQIILLFLLIFTNITISSQTKQNLVLQKQIEKILENKKADVGISIIGIKKNDLTQINGDKFYPMLSTVKFQIALAILNKVQKGELSMNQKLFVKKEELLENTYSPFKKEYPNGNMSITLEEAIKWMVSYSDNNLTDILLRLIDGPETVQNFINSKNFVIKNDEEDMHKDWESQFVNKVTPNEAAHLLKKFNDKKLLNKENTIWLYNAMLNNKSGANRIKGNLSEKTKIAHRTGTSFTNDAGMTGAINDIGIIELPANNKKIFIAIFVHDTYETFENSEKIIAEISKLVFDYYNKK